MLRDTRTELVTSVGLAPAGNRTTGTANGTGVTLQGYGACTIMFAAGTITDGTHTPKLMESDDSTNGTDGNWTDVAAADQLGTLVAITASSVQEVGYIGSKKWVRPTVVSAGTTTGGMFVAINIRSKGSVQGAA